MPTGEPWQKSDRQVSPAEHRYLMTVIATASNPRFWVSRVDIDRPGPTYTIDTIRDIAAQRPDAELYLHHRRRRAGPDPVLEGAEDALALAHFIGVTRPGYELSDAHLPRDAVTLVDVPAMAISSSACRERVAADARSGTSCPTVSSSTSASTASTAPTWARHVLGS